MNAPLFIGEELDWGAQVYFPLTLRQIEAAGILINSAMGCDAEEHSNLLDEPGLFRACVRSLAEAPDPESYRDGTIECFSGILGAPEAEWQRATPVPTELSTGGERGLREANRLLATNSARICALIPPQADDWLCEQEAATAKWITEECQDE